MATSSASLGEWVRSGLAVLAVVPPPAVSQQSQPLSLPDVVLSEVFQCLGTDDLVSAGQVCRRWRSIAKRRGLWQSRALEFRDSHGATSGPASRADTLPNNFRFIRALRFAPCLDSLRISDALDGPDQRCVREALLKTDCKVRALWALWCEAGSVSAGGSWTLQLLLKFGPHLQELTVMGVDPAAMEVVHSASAASLQKLVLPVCPMDDAWLADDFTFLEHPAGRDARGLRSLYAGALPLNATMSLLRANRHTLRELTLRVGVGSAVPNGQQELQDADESPATPSRLWPGRCDRLDVLLQDCDLRALATLTLERYGTPCPDGASSPCRAQRDRVRAALSLSVAGVHVRCSMGCR